MDRSERTLNYRVHRAAPHTVRLWTIQPMPVWEALRAAGTLYVDEGLIPWLEEYRESYDWLREQMGHRVAGYEGRYPWWAYDYKLDLRRYRYLSGQTGSRNVRLELAVPADQVLLSAYGAWHYVLNYWYLPHAAAFEAHSLESDAWDAELEAHGADCRLKPLAEPFHTRLVRSWERVFDVEDLRETNTIQATFERLALGDVVAVTEFTTQPRRSRW